jgi:hypothetical protein
LTRSTTKGASLAVKGRSEIEEVMTNMIYPWRVIRDLTQPLAEKRRQITEMDAELNASRSNPSYQN